MTTKKSGIYLITNVIAQKVYVGSSKGIIRRLIKHRSNLKTNIHYNTHLQAAYNLYGKEAFTYTIIEECSKEEFKVKESNWIRFYDSTNPEKGYNIDIPDQIDYPKSANERKLIYNPIVVVGEYCSVIGRFINIGEVVSKLNIPESKIHYMLDYWTWVHGGEKPSYIKCKSYKGYFCIREEDYKNDFDYLNYKKITRESPTNRKKMEPRSFTIRRQKERGEIPKTIQTKPILVVSCASGVEHIFNSITQCITTLDLNKPKVFHCLNNEFKKYKHKGYYFKRL